MTDLEKVIRGLECCEKDVQLCYGETVCEYYRLSPRCWTTLAHDALALLKAQEPRMMTLDEATKADVCWLEVKDMDRVMPCRIRYSNGYFIKLFEGSPERIGSDEYGTELRCWTSRPTDEQRKAAKWEKWEK